MNARRLALNVAVVGWAAVAVAQPTPTPVDSNVGVQSFAQSYGNDYIRHCSGNASTTLCSADKDCPPLHTCNPLGTPTPCDVRGGEGCGGCYPAQILGPDPTTSLAALAPLNPEWAPIGPMIPLSPSGRVDPARPPLSSPVLLNGTVTLSKINVGGDFSGSHVGDDQNTSIAPDPADNGRLATGNAPDNTLELEWEINKYPLFAWAGEGDRITSLGRWIFDCGHPDPDPGQCSNNAARACISNADCAAGGTCVGGVGACTTDGLLRCITDPECVGTCPACTGMGCSKHCTNKATFVCSTDLDCDFGACDNPTPNFHFRAEMHPPQAVVVLRNKSLPAPHAGRTAPAIPATRADVYISEDGGGAGDRCTVSHLLSNGDVLLGKRCFINHCSVTTSRSCKVDKDCALGETCIRLDAEDRVADVNAPNFNHCSVTTRACAVNGDCPAGETCVPLANFEFDIPLPAPPLGSPTLKIHVTNHKPKGGLMPKPTFIPPVLPATNLHVIVPMATPLPKSGKMPNVYAASISAGWKEDVTPLQHVRVKFKNITVHNPVKDRVPVLLKQCTLTNGFGLSAKPCASNTDCPAGGCSIGSKACHVDNDCPKKAACLGGSTCAGGVTPGWDVFAQVNGDWVQLKKLELIGAKLPFLAAPYLKPSPTPLVIPQIFKFDEFVPPDGSIHIASTGHSLNCRDTLYGTNLVDDLTVLGLGTGGSCLAAGSRDIGQIDLTLAGPDFGTGIAPPGTLVTKTIQSGPGEVGSCSVTTNKLCVSDSDCPGTCSVTAGPCLANGDCNHCSTTTSMFCASNFDCPSGICSNNSELHCHTNSDCGGLNTCTGTPQTCVASGETCSGVESCEPGGTCSNDPSTACTSDGDCTLPAPPGTCQTGAFTLQYTVQIIP